MIGSDKKMKEKEVHTYHLNGNANRYNDSNFF